MAGTAYGRAVPVAREAKVTEAREGANSRARGHVTTLQKLEQLGLLTYEAMIPPDPEARKPRRYAVVVSGVRIEIASADVWTWVEAFGAGVAAARGRWSEPDPTPIRRA